MDTFKPASATDDSINSILRETMLDDHPQHQMDNLYPTDTSYGLYSVDILKYGGIDSRTIEGHKAWIEQSAPWSNGARFKTGSIEPQPPGGWYYRFPSAVPIRGDARTLTEYGPRDFIPYDGSKIYYSHEKISNQPYANRALTQDLPFMRYGIS